MENRFILSSGPHIFAKTETPKIMKDIIIGLLPVGFASIYFFRLRAIVLLATCIISCVVFEYIFVKLM